MCRGEERSLSALSARKRIGLRFRVCVQVLQRERRWPPKRRQCSSRDLAVPALGQAAALVTPSPTVICVDRIRVRGRESRERGQERRWVTGRCGGWRLWMEHETRRPSQSADCSLVYRIGVTDRPASLAAAACPCIETCRHRCSTHRGVFSSVAAGRQTDTASRRGTMRGRR